MEPATMDAQMADWVFTTDRLAARQKRSEDAVALHSI
jgi:hypothetical protein